MHGQLNMVFEGVNDEVFKSYHEANPQIYAAFVKYTKAAIRKGHKNLSAEFIFNVIRWRTPIAAQDSFKINNNYKAYYSRMFMNEFSRYKGFFRTRVSKADLVF